MNKVISVASGKGGTGKTTVASCLALSAPHPVQFLDCDVEEPNAHIFLKPRLTKTETIYLEVPEIDHTRCTFCGKCAEICMYNALAVVDKEVLTFPELCHSCGGCRALCPEQAVNAAPREIGAVESGYAGEIKFARGRLKVGTATSPPLIKAVKKEMERGRLVILDAPPGTSCPVVTTMEDTDFCLLVTEPTAMGLNDLALAVEVARLLNIPCGVIINRCTGTFDKVEKYCRDNNIPVLMKIPLDKEIARAYARGTAPVRVKPGLKEQFLRVLDHIERVTAGEGTCCNQR